MSRAAARQWRGRAGRFGAGCPTDPEADGRRAGRCGRVAYR